ncbi:hypothetical protein H7I76_33135, partial [Mycolicibacterium vaccae]|nr:hypothetical protein [Mycolicibacterium vaccae]
GHLDEGGFDLVILDGEAAPVGGMGIAKQLKDEIGHCPPTGAATSPSCPEHRRGGLEAAALAQNGVDQAPLLEHLTGHRVVCNASRTDTQMTQLRVAAAGHVVMRRR